MKLVTPPTQQSGCPSQAGTVPELQSAHSDGVVDSYGPCVNIQYPVTFGFGRIQYIPKWNSESERSGCRSLGGRSFCSLGPAAEKLLIVAESVAGPVNNLVGSLLYIAVWGLQCHQTKSTSFLGPVLKKATEPPWLTGRFMLVAETVYGKMATIIETHPSSISQCFGCRPSIAML